MIRDRIVVGLKDANLSQKLQLDFELTFKKAHDIVRETEAVKKQQTELRSNMVQLQFSGHQYVADKLMRTGSSRILIIASQKHCVRVKNKRRLCFYNVQNLSG